MISAQFTHDPEALSTQLYSSAVAGFCASFFSLPFDLLKSRLRMHFFMMMIIIIIIIIMIFMIIIIIFMIINFWIFLYSVIYLFIKLSESGAIKYNGVVDAFITILRKEGVLAFWTGFGAYYGRCAPHSMIILLTTEKITAIYRKVFSVNS